MNTSLPLPMVPFSLLILLLFLPTLILTATSTSTSTSSSPSPSPILSNNASSKLLCYRPFHVSKVILHGSNTTLSSPNSTFQLGFFSFRNAAYLGIMYSSIQVPTVVWVANRARHVTNLTFARLEITDGRLVVRDSDDTVLWTSQNRRHVVGDRVVLLDSGNLVLLARDGATVAWQSFDYPTDTWLPGMNLTADRGLISWRSPNNPSPGLYSLRLRPPDYGEFELVYNTSVNYWRTGVWDGRAFANVPEMTVPYIYRFHFVDAYKPTASFWFTERALDGGPDPPLTRFRIDYSGQLRQYTWGLSSQAWDEFWSQPDDKCRVIGLCGQFGVCNSEAAKPCECASGFKPVDGSGWDSGDYSGGCERLGGDVHCESRRNEDDFVAVQVESLGGAMYNTSVSDGDSCEGECLRVCSCVGYQYNERGGLCKHYFGDLWNLRNLSLGGNSSSSTAGGAGVLYLKVKRGVVLEPKKAKYLSYTVFSASIVGSIAVLGLVVGMVAVLIRRRRMRRKGEEEDGELLPVLNLKVFSYKELHTATRGFKDKLGHGGFGAVFLGELSDLTLVAVKRLERPGSGEQQFRAEVCTIGNIQHVNLVRLRGFCSEDSHRLLVYDYMPNGALSVYLRRDGPNLSWDVRFRLAVGTARGIAYLHEGCRDSIIHCDIKPENILLDSDYVAKVSDFGLAKLVRRDFSGTLAADGNQGYTYGYVAPECRPGDPITTKADVYSYGKTLIELLGGHRMWEVPPSLSGKDGVNEVTDSWCFPSWAAQQIIDGNVVAVIDDRLGSKYDIKEAERVALVAVWCIQDDEATRPTMGMVVTMLEGVVEVTVPPAPKLLQALVSGESYCGVNSDSGQSPSLASDEFSGCNIRLSSCGSESSLGNPIENGAVKKESSTLPSPLSSPKQRHSPKRTLMDGVSAMEPADLHPAPTTFIGSSDGDYPVIRSFEDAKAICFRETQKLWVIAGPIAFNILCNYGINSFTNIFAGHLGDLELSAVAISLSVIENFSFGFLLGMASALETLCGQAFGAGQVEMLGVYMQRSWIILIITCFGLLPLYIFSSPILKLLGQEDDIADLAGKFSIQTIPQMLSLAINFPTQKFLQAQSRVSVLAWIGFAAFILHVAILFVFIKLFGWGTGGAAAAFNVSAWGMSLAQVFYILRWCTDGWKGLSWLAFKELWSFAKLSIASAIMLCLEIWYFMTIIVLTGHLDNPVIAVGSLSICMNVNGWEGMLFIGINAAISVRVSNELGSGHARAAKYSVIVTIIESLIIGIFCGAIILAAKDQFAVIFTESKEMQHAVSRLAFLLSITMILNSVQPVISGVAVGGGWQALVAYINLFCYYVVGLPLGFLLGYKTSMRVEGIWIGMIFGTSLQTLILLCIVYKTNWNREVEQASERMKQWTGEELVDHKKWTGQEDGSQTI